MSRSRTSRSLDMISSRFSRGTSTTARESILGLFMNSVLIYKTSRRAMLIYFNSKIFFFFDRFFYICSTKQTDMDKQISTEELKKLLAEGKVKFSFEKLDGTLREAEGTTSQEIIPKDQQPRGGKGPTGTCYYDLEKQTWRCVSLNSKIFI